MNGKENKQIFETVYKQTGNETIKLELMKHLYAQKAYMDQRITLPHHFQAFSADVVPDCQYKDSLVLQLECYEK